MSHEVPYPLHERRATRYVPTRSAATWRRLPISLACVPAAANLQVSGVQDAQQFDTGCVLRITSLSCPAPWTVLLCAECAVPWPGRCAMALAGGFVGGVAFWRGQSILHHNPRRGAEGARALLCTMFWFLSVQHTSVFCVSWTHLFKMYLHKIHC